MMPALRWTTPLLLILAGSPALAATDQLADGLRRCAREADREQRLVCFDALVKSLPKVEADQFGMTAAIAQQREPAAAAAHPAEPAVLPATIAALQEGLGGVWVFTLDNGQVWAQQEPKPGMRFVVGEKVQIEHGAMSSLWLAADKGRKTRVKRVR
jgi:hypothetical protein